MWLKFVIAMQQMRRLDQKLQARESLACHQASPRTPGSSEAGSRSLAESHRPCIKAAYYADAATPGGRLPASCTGMHTTKAKE